MAETIVLFGGTFDPVHHGHLIVARALAEQCRFARITFVPAACPPHKTTGFTAAEHRLAMLNLAIAGEELFDVCELELSRSGPSYTLKTVQALRRQHGPDAVLHWVVGADMLGELPTWHGAAELLDEVRLIVAVRPPWQERLDETFAALDGPFRPEQVARLRGAVVQTPLIDICSTDIRGRVRAGRSIRFLVPEPVRDYIQGHGLYRR